MLVKNKFGNQGIVPTTYVEYIDSDDSVRSTFIFFLLNRPIYLIIVLLNVKDIPPPPAHNPYAAPSLSSTISSPYSSSWDATPTNANNVYVNAYNPSSTSSYKPPAATSTSDSLYMNAWNAPTTATTTGSVSEILCGVRV